MRIAVIGSGISGLASAWLLSRAHEVVLYEADARLGGHTDTHQVEVDGLPCTVDTGFIVHNRAHYPLLSQFFDELGIRTRATTMSFSVHAEGSGLEYNATSLDALFCQRRNVVSPRFLGMLRDLLRFYREAPALLARDDAGPALGEYLATHGYGAAFRDDHLVPMASALWSAPPERILSFPAAYLARFMANHQMLQVAGRPQWRTVEGGSWAYIHALLARWEVEIRLACPVRSVQRSDAGVLVRAPDGVDRYDQVVFACHSDQALRLLSDADDVERDVLDAIPYQDNDVVLHTDASVLPRRRKAWAAWNAFVPADPGAPCTVSYCMNLLQGIEASQPLVVTLNRGDAIDPAKVLRRMRYAHPVYTAGSVAARARKAEIQGRRRAWFAGAYWGWGFHEDGMRSAVEVASGLGVQWGSAGAAAGAVAMPRAAAVEFAG